MLRRYDLRSAPIPICLWSGRKCGMKMPRELAISSPRSSREAVGKGWRRVHLRGVGWKSIANSPRLEKPQILRRMQSLPALTTACQLLAYARRRCPSRQFHHWSFETASICRALIHSPLALPSIPAGSSARAFFITSRYISLFSRKG